MKKASIGTALVAALALSLGLSGVVAADSTTGQIGHYAINDGASFQTAGAACWYSGSGSGPWNIYRLVGRAPSAWWPNTSSTTGQHGTVGWQLIVKHKRLSESTWTLLKKTAVQKKTAYEDAPAYDPNDKAPFTNQWVNITYANFTSDTQFMAIIKIFWYKADGSVKGSVSHTVVEYGKTFGSVSKLTGNSPCFRTTNLN